MKKNIITNLIIILIFLFIAFIFFLLNKRNPGEKVYVYVDGECKGVYSLSEDREVDIKSLYGHNVMVIKNGFANVKSSDCKNQICVNHKKISKNNEQIICIPNKLVIVIKSKKEAEVDDVAG